MYTKEEINKIVQLKLPNGNLADIFSLHCVLFIGNCTEEPILDIEGFRRTLCWNVETNHTNFATSRLPIDYNDFCWCSTEEDVTEQFHDSLIEAIKEKLL